MFDRIKTLGKAIALSATIGAGVLAAVPAQADSLYFSFGSGGSRAGVVIGESGHARHWDRRGAWRDGRDWRGGRDRDWRHGRQSCSPERAVNKANRMGIHRARVADVSRNTITVRGRQYGDRVRVTFARAPGCPIIS